MLQESGGTGEGGLSRVRLARGQVGSREGVTGYVLHRLRVAIFLKALLSVFSVVVSVFLFSCSLWRTCCC